VQGIIMFTARIEMALVFAAQLHRSQARKGGNGIPYLGHLLGVASLVIDDGGTEDEAIAALLHDSLEDQGDSYPSGRQALRATITEQFGDNVAAIVEACTDDEGFSKRPAATPEEERSQWLERKLDYICSIEHKTPQALRVTAADKVHNAESILDSYEIHGPEVWQRFRTKSRRDQIDVYQRLAVAISLRNSSFPKFEQTNLPQRLTRAVVAMEQLPNAKT